MQCVIWLKYIVKSLLLFCKCNRKAVYWKNNFAFLFPAIEVGFANL